MSRLKTSTVELRHLDDYMKCPNYAKYNWTNGSLVRHHFLYQPVRSIIMSAYRDMANLEKKVQWKTLRGRVHTALAPLLHNELEIAEYFKLSKYILEKIRGWYLNTFRDGPTTCLHNLSIESPVPATGLSIATTIDAILLSPDQTSIVEITDKYKDIREASVSFSIRAKVWALKQEDINVKSVLLVHIKEGNINVHEINIRNIDEYCFSVEKSLQWALGSIKHQIFLPSITSMCDSCPYKGVCSW